MDIKNSIDRNQETSRDVREHVRKILIFLAGQYSRFNLLPLHKAEYIWNNFQLVKLARTVR